MNNSKFGTLWLVPTPIDEDSSLGVEALAALRALKPGDSNSIIVVEELKEARRRWLKWGLAREQISKFEMFNEHSSQEELNRWVRALKSGVSVYLMSDCGLPAFCDPGQPLVNLCHQEGVKVRAFPFFNSPILAVALSGFVSKRFVFEGFPSARAPERTADLRRCLSQEDLVIVMDTPYRITLLARQLTQLALEMGQGGRLSFWGMDLNSPEETHLRCSMSDAAQKIAELAPESREFICVLAPKKK